MTYDPVLPSSLDLSSASALAAMLRQRIADGAEIRLDGSSVDRVGQAGLQVLLSAKRSAQHAGLCFEINRPSNDLVGTAKMLGLDTLIASAG